MSAYKKLNKQDAYITTYTAHKKWAVEGIESDGSLLGITVHIAEGDYLNSLQQNYYPTKDSGITLSHSFDPSYQTTLNYPEARTLETGSVIISIPRELYGVAIQPNSFKFIPPYSLFPLEDNIQNTYESFEEWDVDYTDQLPPKGYGTMLHNYIVDDGEGNLVEDMFDVDSETYIRVYRGDIIYNQGMIVLTSSTYHNVYGHLNEGGQVFMEFNSTVPIYTHNYHCKLRESEFNCTYNPSTLDSSTKTTYDNLGDIYNSAAKVNNGELKTNITVPEFQPYITTVGLYNDANELVAVGKLGTPVPKSANTDMTFVVKIDI